eukprot:TRINITY_DN6976_c0_g1_i2.p1 TRINITY_DN6976_c0_g1~~TRINITY_DN6976_c0_g1_i2.p1  ORF type:complete len:160 (+),score=28.06 TRINITY_DN6976_c0_g1_i2:10-489(+)
MVSHDTIRKINIVSGLLMLFKGCLLAMAPPDMVVHYRSLITMHLEDTANGALLIIFGLITPLMGLGGFGRFLFLLAGQIGAWCNGAAFTLSAFTGAQTYLAPLAHSKKDGLLPLDHPYSILCSNLLFVTAISILLAFLIGIYGILVGPPGSSNQKQKQN